VLQSRHVLYDNLTAIHFQKSFGLEPAQISRN